VQTDFQPLNPTIPELLSPPLSPPGLQRGPQRSIAKTSALKLITSFGEKDAKSKYFSGQDGGQTPIAGGVTPIAESAISPDGDMTAFLRPGQRSAFNTPSSARANAVGPFSRQRLPSIGEIDSASARPIGKAVVDLPTPPVDKLEHPRGSHSREPSYGETFQVGMAIGRAATASPMMMRETHRKRDPPPPSPSPASMAILMESQKQAARNGSRTRIPTGVDMHLRPIDQTMVVDQTSPDQSVTSSTRFHWPTRRRGPGSVASSLTSTSSVSKGYRQGVRDTGGKSLDDYIHSLDAARSRASRARSREGKTDAKSDGGTRTRESSRSRKARSRERSNERGRAAVREYTPKAGKRSPRSPVPMSPEDLINLSTPRLLPDPHQSDVGVSYVDFAIEEPSTVRKATPNVRQTSQTRVASRASSKGTRRRSPDRRPPALEIPRGRGGTREGSVVRSPSSPLPMSANAQYFQDSEDEDDYRKAARAQAKFKKSSNRSSSRGFRDASPGDRRERSQSRRRQATKERDSPENRTRTPAPANPAAASVGDLKQIKDERQLKKEAAARELEERRKSLARRPMAPPIPHPHELSPTGTQPPADAFDLPNLASVAQELPPRSQTAEPMTMREAGGTRSMYAPRVPAIGLPATPKAMRLVMAGDPRGAPGVPPIPATFVQKKTPPQSKDGSPQHSPKKEGESTLTLLPSTVYSPPNRPPIARCMSAPPEEPVAPAVLQGGVAPTGLSRGMSLRKLSTPDVSEARQMTRTIDGMIDGRGHSRRASHDQPPPPPPPPMLKELAHLATPPPPPPAPLPFGHANKPVVYGAQGSGTIEIVMDDGQTVPAPMIGTPVVPIHETTVPILAPPAPPSSRGAHHRGRSSVDNSIGARISRATERMRSASRGRNSVASRTKSPETTVAPYESIPMPVGYQPTLPAAPYESVPPPPPMQFQSRPEIRSPIDGKAPTPWGTGLLDNELI
jgi:hypothetical protein